MKKVRYKVHNWREYNRALKNRYSFTLWLDDKVQVEWLAEPTGRDGSPQLYSDLAMQYCTAIRLLLRFLLKRCEGLLCPILRLLEQPTPLVPDYSRLSCTGKVLTDQDKRNHADSRRIRQALKRYDGEGSRNTDARRVRIRGDGSKFGQSPRLKRASRSYAKSFISQDLRETTRSDTE